MCIVEPDSFTDIPAHKASPSWETTYSTRVGDTASILLNYLNQRKLSNNVLAYNFHLKKFSLVHEIVKRFNYVMYVVFGMI